MTSDPAAMTDEQVKRYREAVAALVAASLQKLRKHSVAGRPPRPRLWERFMNEPIHWNAAEAARKIRSGEISSKDYLGCAAGPHSGRGALVCRRSPGLRETRRTRRAVATMKRRGAVGAACCMAFLWRSKTTSIRPGSRPKLAHL